MTDRTPTEPTWLLKQGAMPEQALERIAQRIAVWRDADPDEDESWESFYLAAFDMLSAEVDGIISAVAQPLAASPAAPGAEVEPVAGPILRLPIQRKIGMYGASYDGPQDARAYTYGHQPANEPAWKLGRAVVEARNASSLGDYIDAGLALLRHLEKEGFGVFALVEGESAETAPTTDAIKAQARREALEEIEQALNSERMASIARSEACSDDMVDEFCDRATYFGEAIAVVQSLAGKPGEAE